MLLYPLAGVNKPPGGVSAGAFIYDDELALTFPRARRSPCHEL